MPKNDDSGKVDRISNPEKIVRKNAKKTSVCKIDTANPYKTRRQCPCVGCLNIRKLDKRVTEKFSKNRKKVTKSA